MKNPIATSFTLLTAALLIGAGCGKINILGRKMDQASEHVTTDTPVFEGKLQSAKRIGAMVALQFADGTSYDVRESPASLVPGDTVRIYKTDDGYIAHLWKPSASQLSPSDVQSATPPTTK